MKVYMIVTNDTYEEIVASDIVGMQAAADYVGCSIKSMWTHMKDGKWRGKYKIIDMGFLGEQEEDFVPNENVKPIPENERKIRNAERKMIERQKRKERRLIQGREYYRNNRETMLERIKERYKKNREAICAYGRQYRKDVKEGKRIVNSRNH